MPKCTQINVYNVAVIKYQKITQATDLHPRARRDVPQVDHVPGNAQHGGESGEPAQHVGPPRVLVVHVLYRGPLDDVEDEHALQDNDI